MEMQTRNFYLLYTIYTHAQIFQRVCLMKKTTKIHFISFDDKQATQNAIRTRSNYVSSNENAFIRILTGNLAIRS